MSPTRPPADLWSVGGSEQIKTFSGVDSGQEPHASSAVMSPVGLSPSAHIRVSALLIHVWTRRGKDRYAGYICSITWNSISRPAALIESNRGLRLWWSDMPNNFHYVAVTLSHSLINFLLAIICRRAGVWSGTPGAKSTCFQKNRKASLRGTGLCCCAPYTTHHNPSPIPCRFPGPWRLDW